MASSESDPLIDLFVLTNKYPSSTVDTYVSRLRKGDYHHLLASELARKVLNEDIGLFAPKGVCINEWSRSVEREVELEAAGDKSGKSIPTLFLIGMAALLAFAQATITGPPLPFSSAKTIIPEYFRRHGGKVQLSANRQKLLKELLVDGVAAYRLTPHIELFVFAKAVLQAKSIRTEYGAALDWAQLRCAIFHQRLLSESVSTLESTSNSLIEKLDQSILSSSRFDITREIKTEYLLEKAAIFQYYGHETKSKKAIAEATSVRQFLFAVTGRLGKRTKYQENETSQLVVLARSVDAGIQEASSHDSADVAAAPVNLPLEDDTLLPRIEFSKTAISDEPSKTTTQDKSSKPSPAKGIPLQVQDQVPSELSILNANEQPPLHPQDAMILLSLASSIGASTSSLSRDELTREEMGPFATRVLESGQTKSQGTNLNWQIYTQGLLVRSRIEGYRTRTLERGLLQLVAVRDQVVQDTTDVAEENEDVYKPRAHGNDEPASSNDSSVPVITVSTPETASSASKSTVSATEDTKPTPTTFLPAAKPGESAPASSRLIHVFALASPYVWDLEVELASLWIQVGGLRSALEIYERLEMWAEVGLCWASTDKEGRARGVVRRQLFERTPGIEAQAEDTEELDFENRGENVWKDWQGPERSALPGDAARLFCILGDIEGNLDFYNRAWTVSKGRYARAQKSLGKKYFAAQDYNAAGLAFELCLKARQLDQHVWYLIGCCNLKLLLWKEAVRAFTRAVELDQEDAESWTNLSAAYLGLGEEEERERKAGKAEESVEKDEEDEEDEEANPEQPEHRSKKPEQIAKWAAQVGSDKGIVGIIPRPVTIRDRRVDALKTLKFAARLRRNDFRIWDNMITIASGMSPIPYNDIIVSFRRVIEIRGAAAGEKSIDASILDLLVRYVTGNFDPPKPNNTISDLSGESRMLVDLVERAVIPLITTNARLWQSVARLELWRKRPSEALSAHEKAWRCVTGPKEWETGIGEEGIKLWERVVEATEELADAYESFGPMEAGDGDEGAVVMKEWKFKTRSAIRGVLGRAKDGWEDSDGWNRLNERLEQMRQSSAV